MNASIQAHLSPRLGRLFPFLQWWPRVNRVTLRADAIAGAVGALIVLPQGVAFATIAGMPPEYGLYAAMVPAIVAALFGSSWHLVSGPTTAISIVIYSTMSTLAEPGSGQYVELVLLATFLTGVFQLAMGVGRLGVLVNFISHTVVVGFTAGAGLLIAGSQLQHFFGIPMERGMSFVESIEAFVTGLGTIDWYITSVGLVTLLVGIAVRQNYPKFPYMIAAMIAGSLFALLLTSIPGHPAIGHIATVTALPAALPQFSVPEFTLEALRKTASIAVAITILGLTEAVSIARAIGLRSEQRIDGNQEFIGQGLSNVLGAFLFGLRLERLFQPQRAQLRSRRENTARADLLGVPPDDHTARDRAARALPPDPGDGGHSFSRGVGSRRRGANPQHRAHQPLRKRGARSHARGNAHGAT